MAQKLVKQIAIENRNMRINRSNMSKKYQYIKKLSLCQNQESFAKKK
jgi:hypothetical protein